MTDYKHDILRYGGKASMYIKMLHYTFRRYKKAKHTRLFWFLVFKIFASRNHLEISPKCNIGPGLYIGHPFCITINPEATLGRNINIHKGATIGQSNRGTRKGVPTIGNDVWIGINATIVGNITIGDDILIAPNSYVNCDIPSHSIVLGNPCVIKPCENATEGYVNHKC